MCFCNVLHHGPLGAALGRLPRAETTEKMPRVGIMVVQVRPLKELGGSGCCSLKMADWC